MDTDKYNVFIHTEDLQKLCWICCQFLGKGSYYKEKHQENIKDIFLINIKIDNPSIHPDKICQKCYCVMSSAIKWKSTITTAVFKNWTEHNVQQCHICDRIRFLQKGVLGTQKFAKEKSKRQTKGRIKGLPLVKKFLWFTCSANKINNISCSNITRSQEWGIKSPYFSQHMQNLFKKNQFWNMNTNFVLTLWWLHWERKIKWSLDALPVK